MRVKIPIMWFIVILSSIIVNRFFDSFHFLFNSIKIWFAIWCPILSQRWCFRRPRWVNRSGFIRSSWLQNLDIVISFEAVDAASLSADAESEFLPRNSYTRIEKLVFQCCQFEYMPTTIWIYCKVEFKFWATMAVNLSGLNSMQYLLICRAGLAASAESEAASTASKLMTMSRFWSQLLRMNPDLFTHLGRRKHQRWLRIGHQMANQIWMDFA